MKKQITTTIFRGLLFSFLAGSISSIAVLMILDAQTPDFYEDGTPKRNCFPGLGYAIVIAIQVLLLIGNSLAFLHFYKTVRENRFLSFVSYFGVSLLYLVLLLGNAPKFSKEYFLILIPWIHFMVWTFYYFKIRKILNSNS